MQLEFRYFIKDESAFLPGAEQMRLRLIYKGILPSRKKDPETGQFDKLAGPIHEIRRQIHPQLKNFWIKNKFLSSAKQPSVVSQLSPAEASARWDDGPGQDASPFSEYVAHNFVENGYRFAPLVCSYWNLSCALDILMLRHDQPGSPLDHGDLDNRVKSLIDGLRKPDGPNELREHPSPSAGEDPFFVLLQNDDLVTDLKVETDWLLTPVDQKRPENDVVAIISVEIRPYDISTFNLGFA